VEWLSGSVRCARGTGLRETLSWSDLSGRGVLCPSKAANDMCGWWQPADEARLGVEWWRQLQKVGGASAHTEEGARSSGAHCHGTGGRTRERACGGSGTGEWRCGLAMESQTSGPG
jgi:hypothetical protein